MTTNHAVLFHDDIDVVCGPLFPIVLCSLVLRFPVLHFSPPVESKAILAVSTQAVLMRLTTNNSRMTTMR